MPSGSTPGRERLADYHHRRVIVPQEVKERQQMEKARLEARIQHNKQQQADLKFAARQYNKRFAECAELDPSDARFRSSPQLQKLRAQGAHSVSTPLHSTNTGQSARQPSLPPCVDQSPDQHRHAGVSPQQQQQREQEQQQEQQRRQQSTIPQQSTHPPLQQQQQQKEGQLANGIGGELLQGLDLDGPAGEAAASDRYKDSSADEWLMSTWPVCDNDIVVTALCVELRHVVVRACAYAYACSCYHVDSLHPPADLNCVSSFGMVTPLCPTQSHLNSIDLPASFWNHMMKCACPSWCRMQRNC